MMFHPMTLFCPQAHRHRDYRTRWRSRIPNACALGISEAVLVPMREAQERLTWSQENAPAPVSASHGEVLPENEMCRKNPTKKRRSISRKIIASHFRLLALTAGVLPKTQRFTRSGCRVSIVTPTSTRKPQSTRWRYGKPIRILSGHIGLRSCEARRTAPIDTVRDSLFSVDITQQQIHGASGYLTTTALWCNDRASVS
jgi:hypothetical protein